MINFNPNRRPNDSLSPEEIAAKAEQRNLETRELTKRAYLTAEVPVTHAERAADHSSVTRQTAEAKKARKDAATWSRTKAGEGKCIDADFWEPDNNA
jgi:hypothetical protein